MTTTADGTDGPCSSSAAPAPPPAGAWTGLLPDPDWRTDPGWPDDAEPATAAWHSVLLSALAVPMAALAALAGWVDHDVDGV